MILASQFIGQGKKREQLQLAITDRQEGGKIDFCASPAVAASAGRAGQFFLPIRYEIVYIAKFIIDLIDAITQRKK